MQRILRKIGHYYSALGLSGVLLFLIAKLLRTQILFKKMVPGIVHPVYVRVGTTDVSVFRQVLQEKQYDFQLQIAPKLIIDAGANIGLSAVFFANLYPLAKIVAIEPEGSNIEVLKKNAAPYPQITILEAALWSESQEIALLDDGQGNDGFRTGQANAGGQSPSRLVKGVTVDSIMREFGVDSVDVLKIDIEGSEKEVLENSSSWISHVGVIMAELHDHLKDGCSRAFFKATETFSFERTRGETVMRAKLAS